MTTSGSYQHSGGIAKGVPSIKYSYKNSRLVDYGLEDHSNRRMFVLLPVCLISIFLYLFVFRQVYSGMVTSNSVLCEPATLRRISKEQRPARGRSPGTESCCLSYVVVCCWATPVVNCVMSCTVCHWMQICERKKYPHSPTRQELSLYFMTWGHWMLFQCLIAIKPQQPNLLLTQSVLVHRCTIVPWESRVHVCTLDKVYHIHGILRPKFVLNPTCSSATHYHPMVVTWSHHLTYIRSFCEHHTGMRTVPV